jgi:hypothetical protein
MAVCYEESRPLTAWERFRIALRELFCWHQMGEWQSAGKYVFPFGNHPGFIRYYRHCSKCTKSDMRHEPA